MDQSAQRTGLGRSDTINRALQLQDMILTMAEEGGGEFAYDIWPGHLCSLVVHRPMLQLRPEAPLPEPPGPVERRRWWWPW